MTSTQPLDMSNLRYWRQNAQMAIRGVYDALVELITNADDRYVILDRPGAIEIEVERRRKESPSIVKVRDFADGMTISVMRKKLARLGDRVSGMERGLKVRGTNSRGAKDIAVLGGVVFESIAEDGQYHRCEISSSGYFKAFEPSPVASDEHRDSLRIRSGTGTLVTLNVNPNVASVPQHDNLREQLALLVPLRDVLSSPKRTVTLIDVNKERKDVVKAAEVEGHEVLKERLTVPGYQECDAKLVIKRASKRLENGKLQFREGGILIKSGHAIHEATLFAPELEHDPCAAWFFGRLTCEGIDQLWNEYDERAEKGVKPSALNPMPIVDPMRKQGLTREHPFVRALFGEALKRLRPLVEAERKQQEARQTRIETDETRRRLRVLEKEATKFIDRYLEQDDTARDPDDRSPDTQLRRKGFSFNPPFAQIVVGHSVRFWLNISLAAFPELAVGEVVELTCSSEEIFCERRVVLLEAHPAQQDVLRAVWVVKGTSTTTAAEITVRVGSIVASSTIEVLESERDKYRWVTELTFDAKRYRVRVGASRSVKLFAPFPDVVSAPTRVDISCSDAGFHISGEPVMQPYPDVGVAICRLRLQADKPDRKALITANLANARRTAEAVSVEPLGSSISIELKPVDHVNQRYRWYGSVLHVAAKHPSVRRYLGPHPEYAGQEEKHFRVLLAEIVAEAVCSLVISKNAALRREEYEDFDWDAYYAEYTKLMTEFLPIAHESQVKDP